MATLKQCDRCKILKKIESETTMYDDWKKIIRTAYMTMEYEICNDCDADFITFMTNIHEVKPRKGV